MYNEGAKFEAATTERIRLDTTCHPWVPVRVLVVPVIVYSSGDGRAIPEDQITWPDLEGAIPVSSTVYRKEGRWIAHVKPGQHYGFSTSTRVSATLASTFKDDHFPYESLNEISNNQAFFEFYGGDHVFIKEIEQVEFEPPLLEESLYQGHYTLSGVYGTEWILQGTVLLSGAHGVTIPDADGWDAERRLWHKAIESVTSSHGSVETYVSSNYKWSVRLVGNHHAPVELTIRLKPECSATSSDPFVAVHVVSVWANLQPDYLGCDIGNEFGPPLDPTVAILGASAPGFLEVCVYCNSQNASGTRKFVVFETTVHLNGAVLATPTSSCVLHYPGAGCTLNDPYDEFQAAGVRPGSTAPLGEHRFKVACANFVICPTDAYFTRCSTNFGPIYQSEITMTEVEIVTDVGNFVDEHRATQQKQSVAGAVTWYLDATGSGYTTPPTSDPHLLTGGTAASSTDVQSFPAFCAASHSGTCYAQRGACSCAPDCGACGEAPCCADVCLREACRAEWCLNASASSSSSSCSA